MFCDEHGTLDYCPYCLDEERALDINKELLEALEGLLRKFGDFENDQSSRGIGWNPEMIEALHDAENAIAKAKS